MSMLSIRKQWLFSCYSLKKIFVKHGLAPEWHRGFYSCGKEIISVILLFSYTINLCVFWKIVLEGWKNTQDTV